MPEPLDPQDIVHDAHWLAQAYDPGLDLVRFVAMAPEDYRAAAFLDDRLFERWRDVRTLPWPVVKDAMSAASGMDARWIFHIGHVGSTMLARMLGEVGSVLSIREPRILRDLAMLDSKRRSAMAPTVQALCSRTFAAEQRGLIKATSFVSETAPLLVPPGGLAIFMHADARSYIETILAGENSVKELLALADSRDRRMAKRLSLMTSDSQAHRAAKAWACEMTALEAAALAMPDRSISWLDFDEFLVDPVEGLTSAAGHLGIAMSRATAHEIVAGPLLRRYSKALEYEYSPELRRELQSEARHRHGVAIDSALEALKEASRTSPLLGRALKRSNWRD